MDNKTDLAIVAIMKNTAKKKDESFLYRPKLFFLKFKLPAEVECPGDFYLIAQLRRGFHICRAKAA